MDANEKSLTLFQTRVRQLILKFSEIKKENEELYAMVDQKEAEVKQLKAQLAQAQNDYNSLKMARMLEITDGDLEGAKARVAKMIREVDKAIKLLSAEWLAETLNILDWTLMAEENKKLQIRLHLYDTDMAVNSCIAKRQNSSQIQ